MEYQPGHARRKLRPSANLLLPVSMFILSIAGCGPGPEVASSPPSLKSPVLGENVTIGPDEEYVATPAPAPTLTIVAPVELARFQAGEFFDSDIRVAVPLGGRLPRRVLGGIAKKQYSGLNFIYRREQKLGEDTYLLRAKMKAPREPGRYHLWAESISYVFISANEDGREQEIRDLRHRSVPLVIGVVP